MIDTENVTPEQLSELVVQMKEASNKALLLQKQIDEVFLHSKAVEMCVFHDTEDKEVYFLNSFEASEKGVSLISTSINAIREFLACDDEELYKELVKKHTVKRL